MRLIEQSAELLYAPGNIEQLTEVAGRTCYQSHDKITDGSAKKFVRKIVNSGHGSVLEHMTVTIKFITSRSVMAELTRHRIASFSVESTRYCDLGDGPIQFVRPMWLPNLALGEYFGDVLDYSYNMNLCAIEYEFLNACMESEYAYKALRLNKVSPQDAREVLNQALKTEIVMSANMREWRHVVSLRTGPGAHPMIRDLIYKALAILKPCAPTVFEDMEEPCQSAS